MEVVMDISEQERIDHVFAELLLQNNTNNKIMMSTFNFLELLGETGDVTVKEFIGFVRRRNEESVQKIIKIIRETL